jgi:hypothetical protein
MSTPNDVKPFGMNQIILVSRDGETQVQLMASRTLEFEESVVTGEFTGDDELQGLMTVPTGVKGKIEAGGISLEAYALMTGHTFNTSGSTPNQVGTMEGDANRYPYFQIFGKSLGDETDDIHIKIYKAKLTSGLKGSFKYGEFMATEIEFMAVKENGKAFDFVINETAADIEVGS